MKAPVTTSIAAEPVELEPDEGSGSAPFVFGKRALAAYAAPESSVTAIRMARIRLSPAPSANVLAPAAMRALRSGMFESHLPRLDCPDGETGIDGLVLMIGPRQQRVAALSQPSMRRLRASTPEVRNGDTYDWTSRLNPTCPCDPLHVVGCALGGPAAR